MKSEPISLTLAAALGPGLAGCSKNEPVTITADDANKAASSTAEAVSRTAEAAKVEAAKADEAAKTTEADKAKTAEAAKAADNGEAQAGSVGGFLKK